MFCASTPVIASPAESIEATPLKIKGVQDLTAINRLYFYANGPSGPTTALQAGTFFDQLTVNGQYVVPKPPPDLPGAPYVGCSFQVWNEWMEFFGPTVALHLGAGDLLEAHTLEVVDPGIAYMAAERAVPLVTLVKQSSTWLAFRCTAEKNITHRVEVPYSRRGGWLTGFAVGLMQESAYTPHGNDQVFEIGFETPNREIVPPVPFSLWRTWMRERRLPAELSTVAGEPLYMVTREAYGTTHNLAFAGEWASSADAPPKPDLR